MANNSSKISKLKNYETEIGLTAEFVPNSIWCYYHYSALYMGEPGHQATRFVNADEFII